jgi:hypothetical protein
LDTPSKNQWPPIVGARDIARYLFGDNGRESSIYEAGLPLFKIGGRVAAFREDLNRTMLARERAELEACEQRQKILSERIAIKTAKERMELEACERRREVLASRVAAKTGAKSLTEVAEGLK